MREGGMPKKKGPSGNPYAAIKDVFGYNISVVKADRGAGESLCDIRLVKRVNNQAEDVGYLAFYPNGAVLAGDFVRAPGTAQERIVMHAHIGDLGRILDQLRHERQVRICFTGTSPTQGFAWLTSLTFNF
jgi:hypothetical protein